MIDLKTNFKGRRKVYFKVFDLSTCINFPHTFPWYSNSVIPALVNILQARQTHGPPVPVPRCQSIVSIQSGSCHSSSLPWSDLWDVNIRECSANIIRIPLDNLALGQARYSNGGVRWQKTVRSFNLSVSRRCNLKHETFAATRNSAM